MALVLAGAAIPFLLLALVLRAQGALDDFSFWCFRYAREYAQLMTLADGLALGGRRLLDIAASVGKRAVRVVFGMPPYRSKVRLAAKIEGELGRRNARPTTVFLDDDRHPDRIVVRLVSALPGAQVTVDNEAAKGKGKALP